MKIQPIKANPIKTLLKTATVGAMLFTPVLTNAQNKDKLQKDTFIISQDIQVIAIHNRFNMAPSPQIEVAGKNSLVRRKMNRNPFNCLR